MDIFFPRVTLIDIRTKEDITGTGDGLLDEPIPGVDITRKFADKVNELLKSEEQLIYELEVSAKMEDGANATARSFVRAKNLTTLSDVTIIQNDLVNETGPFSLELNTYRVTVGITK